MKANLENERHGPTELTRAERSRISTGFNEICNRYGLVAFNDMCSGSQIVTELPDNPLTLKGNETRVNQQLDSDGLAIEYSYAWSVYHEMLPKHRRGLPVALPRDIPATTMFELAQLVADLAERRKNLRARRGS